MRRLLDFGGSIAFLPLKGLDTDGVEIAIDAPDFDERICDYLIQLEDGETVIVSADLLHAARLSIQGAQQ